MVHLSDSYVAMSILAKGRTGSKVLTYLTRRIAAVLLASGSYLIQAHVDSAELRIPLTRGAAAYEEV